MNSLRRGLTRSFGPWSQSGTRQIGSASGLSPELFADHSWVSFRALAEEPPQSISQGSGAEPGATSAQVGGAAEGDAVCVRPLSSAAFLLLLLWIPPIKP